MSSRASGQGHAKTRRQTNMTATQTEIEGKATNLRALLLKEKPTLVAAGINVDLFVQVLTTKLETTTTLNADQEGRKRGLKESTVKVEAAYRDLDSTTSGFLDAIMGAVGKPEVVESR